ncbi:MAG: hypothetical protein ABIT05_04475 [Chitinophagaceae bacterium]
MRLFKDFSFTAGLILATVLLITAFILIFTYTGSAASNNATVVTPGKSPLKF